MTATSISSAPAADLMLRAALDASLDGHALWSPIYGDDGQVVDLQCDYLNPAGAALLARPAGAIVGARLAAWGHVGAAQGLAAALLQVSVSGWPLRRRIRLVNFSGAQVWGELSAVRLAGGVSVCVRDVTAEEALRERLEAALADTARLAATDPLTGVANRRGWAAGLARELERAGASGWPLTVAILDLDQFKAFNDEYGHQAGDRLLVDTTQRWQASLPADATLARLGGEEFAVVLPNTDATLARKILSELCALVPAGQTASAGLTVWDGSETDSSLLGRADAALYAAKRAGRNQVAALYAM